jgi:hypothetical protein
MSLRSKRRVWSLVAVMGCVLAVGGCNFSKTGALPPDAPDVVSVVPTVTGGATSVTLDPALVDALTSAGATLKPTGSARVSGGVAAFPITSGYLEVHRDRSVKPGWIQGSLAHAGSGLDVTAAGQTVTLSDFVVDPGGSMLYATVNGKLNTPLLFLDGTHVTEGVNDVGQVVLQGTVAKLTQGAASLLGTTLGLPAGAISPGATFGTVKVQAASGAPLPAGAQNFAGITGASYDASTDHVTAIPRLTGQATTLSLLPQVASALSSAGLKLAPTGTATASGTAITFPITAGMVAIHSNKGFQPGYVVGTVDHQGSGLTISAGGTAGGGGAGASSAGGGSLNLSDFVVDPGDSVLTGTVGGGKPGTPLFFLDGSKLHVTPTANGATLDGTVAELTQEAAKALDTTFATSVFSPGMPIGTVHLVATGS